MSISLSKENQELFQKTYDYRVNKLAPLTLKLDQDPELTKSTLLDMAKHGFCGLQIPKNMGGHGYNYLQSALVYEGLAYGDGVMSFLM